jgi:uncharacterized repeat protein (TIGR02543 family)
MKKCFWLALAMLMLLSVLPAAASASDDGVEEISTAEQLMAVLESDSSSDTYKKTYVLQNDITIDTSELETSYSTGSGYARLFRGMLDGDGHTITVVNEEGAAAKPLFDSIRGEKNNYYAGVKNLNVVFKDNVAGTTIAAHTSYVRISDVDISFEKDIVFATNISGYAIAAGVYGFTSQNIDVRLENVSVNATGESPYGIIGSTEAQDAKFVFASGIYSEWNAAGGDVICDGVDVNVRGIYAVSKFADSNVNYSTCCAAGIASGYSQTNLRLGNANVVVEQDISAGTTEDSTADADAYGLGYHLLAMYNCNVNVGGNIEATANKLGSCNSVGKYGQEETVSAAGFGFIVQSKYNLDVFDSADTGACNVTVGGNIIAEIKEPQDTAISARACGAAVWSSNQYVWKNVAVNVTGDIKASCSGMADAYANGFIHQVLTPYNISDYGCEACSVTASSIIAESSEYGGYASGFMRWCYTPCKGCSVSVGTIIGSGIEAVASGFAYRFSPCTSATGYGTLDGCSVLADNIISTNTDAIYGAYTAGFALETDNPGGYNHYSGEILNCTVTINEQLSSNSADGIATKALFVFQNVTDKYELHNNTVTLPKSQADVQTIDGVDYVRFTASELPGQAEAEGWESDNRVIFTGDSINSVSCAFDDSNTTYGTLWELTLVSQYFTLSYNSNGGTEYVDELYLEGTEVQLDKVPELDGHTFAGWFADEDLTQQIDTITMNDHSTVHAGWEKDEEPWTPPYIPPETPVTPSEPVYTPNWLNTTDHVSYIIGYSDGTVKPGAGITRAEVATIFFRLLTDGARERFWSETNAYTDVAAGSWYNIAVSTLSNMGILGGYEDGTFRPNASITRAEFAKIAVSFFDWADVYAVNSFVDVRDSAWYANYVAVAAELGLIEGYGGNVFRPDATITRAEACTIINRTLGRAPDADHLLPVSQMNTWPDNSDTGVWYYAQIQEATNSHDYRWLGDVEQWTAKLADPDWDKLQY